MGLKKYLKAWRRFFHWIDGKCLDLLYPPRCPVCDKVTLPTDGVCRLCRKKITVVKEPSCMKCGKPISNARREFCSDCKRHAHRFTQGKALWVYEAEVKKSIYRFKYQNKREYGSVYAAEMAKAYGSWVKQKRIQAVLPIPLYSKKKRKRGYNQSEILAKELGRLLKLPVCTDALIRTQETLPQKTLNYAERKQNVRNAFASAKKTGFQRILLVDDIYTTGSTLDAAADVLLQAGMSEVFACCISIGQDRG